MPDHLRQQCCDEDCYAVPLIPDAIEDCEFSTSSFWTVTWTISGLGTSGQWPYNSLETNVYEPAHSWRSWAALPLPLVKAPTWTSWVPIRFDNRRNLGVRFRFEFDGDAEKYARIIEFFDLDAEASYHDTAAIFLRAKRLFESGDDCYEFSDLVFSDCESEPGTFDGAEVPVNDVSGVTLEATATAHTRGCCHYCPANVVVEIDGVELSAKCHSNSRWKEEWYDGFTYYRWHFFAATSSNNEPPQLDGEYLSTPTYAREGVGGCRNPIGVDYPPIFDHTYAVWSIYGYYNTSSAELDAMDVPAIHVPWCDEQPKAMSLTDQTGPYSGELTPGAGVAFEVGNAVIVQWDGGEQLVTIDSVDGDGVATFSNGEGDELPGAGTAIAGITWGAQPPDDFDPYEASWYLEHSYRAGWYQRRYALNWALRSYEVEFVGFSSEPGLERTKLFVRIPEESILHGRGTIPEWLPVGRAITVADATCDDPVRRRVMAVEGDGDEGWIEVDRAVCLDVWHAGAVITFQAVSRVVVKSDKIRDWNNDTFVQPGDGGQKKGLPPEKNDFTPIGEVTRVLFATHPSAESFDTPGGDEPGPWPENTWIPNVIVEDDYFDIVNGGQCRVTWDDDHVNGENIDWDADPVTNARDFMAPFMGW